MEKTFHHPVLMAAFREISGTPDKTGLRIFHEMQASILTRRAEAGQEVRRTIHEPKVRDDEYQELDLLMDRDLFRALWSCFPSVRKLYPSSVLKNNREDLPMT